MDSLNGESDENGQEVDEYERSKIEKSIRNRQNRAKNRALREQEQKEQMAIYGPGAEQKHGKWQKPMVAVCTPELTRRRTPLQTTFGKSMVEDQCGKWREIDRDTAVQEAETTVVVLKKDLPG